LVYRLQAESLARRLKAVHQLFNLRDQSMQRIIAIALSLIFAGQTLAQTNEIPPERPFTLLLITATGGSAGMQNMADPREAMLRTMLHNPRTAEMVRWATWSTVKELAASSALVQERHSDILQDAESLPALALVDSLTGDRWHLMSGRGLPRDEYDLATQLDVFFAATQQAIRDAGTQRMQTVPRQQYDAIRSGRWIGQDSGPEPYAPAATNNSKLIPTNFDATFNTGVDPETRAWSTRLVSIICGCVLVVVFALLAAVWYSHSPHHDVDD
jgi:hypothetical protein